MAVLPDNIKEINDSNITEQIRTIYDYIHYMRERIEFWGSNVSKANNQTENRITQIEERIAAIEELIEE